MAELEFSRSEVEGLAAKLVSVDLSECERELLLAIFWAAAEQVSPAPPQAAPDPDGLGEQLVHSFLPDSGEEFMILRIKRIGI
jgi:hypothetical protein